MGKTSITLNFLSARFAIFLLKVPASAKQPSLGSGNGSLHLSLQDLTITKRVPVASFSKLPYPLLISLNQRFFNFSIIDILDR